MVTNALGKAIEDTLKIAEALPHKDNLELYKKSVLSIFDDRLQAVTKMNRTERRNAKKLMIRAMKDNGIK